MHPGPDGSGVVFACVVFQQHSHKIETNKKGEHAGLYSGSIESRFVVLSTQEWRGSKPLHMRIRWI